MTYKERPVFGYRLRLLLPIIPSLYNSLIISSEKRTHQLCATRFCNFFAAAQRKIPSIFPNVPHCLQYILAIRYSLIDPFIDALVSPFRAIWTRHVRNVLRFPTRAYHYRTSNCSSTSHGCSSKQQRNNIPSYRHAQSNHSYMDGYRDRKFNNTNRPNEPTMPLICESAIRPLNHLGDIVILQSA